VQQKQALGTVRVRPRLGLQQIGRPLSHPKIAKKGPIETSMLD
jgi:hypothetical protein